MSNTAISVSRWSIGLYPSDSHARATPVPPSPRAPIFEIAEFGVGGDLFTVVPSSSTASTNTRAKQAAPWSGRADDVFKLLTTVSTRSLEVLLDPAKRQLPDAHHGRDRRHLIGDSEPADFPLAAGFDDGIEWRKHFAWPVGQFREGPVPASPNGNELHVPVHPMRFAMAPNDRCRNARPQAGARLLRLRGAMITDFPSYAPSEEHELLRRTARDIADAKIAPAATASERAVNGDKVNWPAVRLRRGQAPGLRPRDADHHQRGPTARRRRMVLRMVVGLVLTVAAFAIAGRRVWWLKRLAFSGPAGPERVCTPGPIPAEARAQLTEVLGQRKLLKWTVPGAAHARRSGASWC